MNIAQPGVCYSATLPLSWSLAKDVTPTQLDYWRHANVSMLRALAHIESLPGDLEKDLGTAAKAYERLEAKLDVVMDMLGRLLAQGLVQPAPHSLTLWPDAVAWLDHAAPALRSEIQIALYLSPKLPQPLNLMAHVDSVQQEDAGPANRRFGCDSR